ncbi:SDR family oxidoreductase [Streptomyces sp. NPDC008122]|uniref:SDR family oxidoreductase n=1 Tax=Streptomyces sp. NPDC008122 TaxID=3364810 RepID=UPI0036E10B51
MRGRPVATAGAGLARPVHAYSVAAARSAAVCPGVIETPMVADMLEGHGRDHEAAVHRPRGHRRRDRHAVLWLCSQDATFVIGVALPVDGGFTTH